MTNQTRSTDTQHQLQKAYELIFGQDPRGTGLIIERETLAKTFRDKAYRLRPDRAQELGKSREELSAMLKGVAVAFDLLADVVGEAEKVWIMPVVDELHPDTVRPWAPRTASAKSVTFDAPAPSRDVEDATRRIKDAIGKLRAHTEKLSQARTSEAQVPNVKVEIAPEAAPAPKKSLILGRHLHRRGLITLRQLIAAVAWQRAQRPAVGQIAKSWGILTDEQIFEVLQKKSQGELFCDYAVRMGMMTPFQRLAVVGRQRVMQKPIGSYFVEEGILTDEQVETEVKSLRSIQGAAEREQR